MTPDSEIFCIIKSHVGHENAISARAIADELGWAETKEREVRRIVAEYSSKWPAIVCAAAGNGDSGYFVAANYQEIEAYWAHLDDLRAAAELKVHNFENLCRKNGIQLHYSSSSSKAA